MPETTVLKSKIPAESAGQPLIDYISARFRYQTRETWKKIIGDGSLSLNGRKVPPETLLKKGDWVAYAVVLNEPAVPKNIEFLHEEEGFLVAVKPALLPSHADGNFIKNTFIFLIQEKLKEKEWKGQAHLVHRLDRETSGLMVVAKDRPTLRNLAGQFEKGLVEKEYLAIAQNAMDPGPFELDGSIGRDPASKISIRYAVVPAATPYAKPSVTRFEVLKSFPQATLLRCLPLTGRTSQIRVHLASTGHPLVHDKLYGRTDDEFLDFVAQSKREKREEDFENRPRHFLHAAKLAFFHPQTGKKLLFESEMPKDMKRFMENLEKA